MAETDAASIKFPVQMVVTVVSTILTVALSVTGSTWALRSDVRDIQTRLEVRADKEREERITRDAAWQEMRQEVRMLQFQVQDMNLALAEAGIKRKAK